MYKVQIHKSFIKASKKLITMENETKVVGFFYDV